MSSAAFSISPRNIVNFVADSAARLPLHAAVIDNQGVLSFGDLDRAVQQLIAALKRHGAEAGQGVIMAARNGRSFVTGLFAALGAGGPVLPVPPTITAPELDALLKESGFRWLLDDGSPRWKSDRTEKLIELPCGMKFRIKKTGNDESIPCSAPLPDAACIRFTSGTTGKAKGVALTVRAVIERTEAARAALQLLPGDRVAWVLPMAFHYIASVLTYVRYGITTVVISDFTGAGIAQAIGENRCTILYGSPSHYQLLRGAANLKQLDSLRAALSTSAATPEDVASAFRASTHIPLSPLFGIIEVGVPIGNFEGDSYALGRPLPPYEARISASNGESTGELLVRGPGMFDAYVAPFIPASEILKDGWFPTGDLATQDDGGLIFLKGRKKSLINCAGLKVFPEEIEDVLRRHDLVAEARAFGEKHAEFGEVVAVEVALSPRAGIHAPEIIAEELRKHCLQQLSIHKVPKSFRIVSSIPRTATGKILRI